MTTVSFPAQVRAVHANLHSVTLCLDVDAFADIYGWLGVDHGIANPTVPGGPFRVSLDGVDRVFPRPARREVASYAPAVLRAGHVPRRRAAVSAGGQDRLLRDQAQAGPARSDSANRIALASRATSAA